MRINEICRAFGMAWELVIDLPCPGFLKTGKKPDWSAQPGLFLLYFPLLGGVIGLAFFLGFRLLQAILPNHLISSLLFAAAALVLVAWKDSGRSLGILTSAIDRFCQTKSWQAALADLNSEWRMTNNPLANLVSPAVLLFQFVAFLLMAFDGYAYWIIPVLTLDFAAQALLATLPSLISGEALIDGARDGENLLGLATAVVLVFILPAAPWALLTTALLAFFGVMGFKSYCLGRFHGIDGTMVTLGGTLTQLLALLIGLCFLT